MKLVRKNQFQINQASHLKKDVHIIYKSHFTFIYGFQQTSCHFGQVTLFEGL